MNKDRSRIIARRRQIRSEIHTVARIFNFLTSSQQKYYENLAEEYSKLGEELKGLK